MHVNQVDLLLIQQLRHCSSCGSRRAEFQRTARECHIVNFVKRRDAFGHLGDAIRRAKNGAAKFAHSFHPWQMKRPKMDRHRCCQQNSWTG
jgi:hypothetical protein